METITVFCNEAMIRLLAPIEVSKPVVETGMLWRESKYAAIYDHEALRALSEDEVCDAGAWWRQMGACNTSIEWDPETIKTVGIWSYLCDGYGISAERNVAVALADLADNAGMTPIELMNWLAENRPTEQL